VKKDVTIVIGLIVIICVFFISFLYVIPHINRASSNSTVAKVPRSVKVVVFKKMLDNIIRERFHNYFVRIGYERDVFIGHLESKFSRNNNTFTFIVTVFIRGLEYGYVKKENSIVGYGHVDNITVRYLGVNYADGNDVLSRKLIVELDNATLLYVWSRGSSRYCIDGLLIIRYFSSTQNYNNVTRIHVCMSVIPLNISRLYFSNILYLTDQIITERLERIGILHILPMLVSNITYIGKMRIGGETCNMYSINNIVHVSDLLSNKSIIMYVISNASKMLRININSRDVENKLSQISDIMDIMGVSTWYFESTFCISNNTLIYLTAHVHNLGEGIVNIRVKASIYTKDYKIYENYIDKTLYDTAISIQKSRKSKISDISRLSALWLCYISLTDPVSRLLTSLVFTTTEIDILDMLNAAIYLKHEVATSASATSNGTINTVNILVKNVGVEPISSLTIVVSGNRTSRIKINCTVPVSQNSTINITCVGDLPCKVTVIGSGKCTCEGSLPNIAFSRAAIYHVIIHVRFLDNVVTVSEIPLVITRHGEGR